MLADGQHPDAAGGRIGLGDELGHRRHVAILHRHPDRRLAALRQPQDVPAVLDRRAQRLLDQDRLAGRQHVAQDPRMRVVGAGDDQHIAGVRRQQFAVVGEGADAVALRPGSQHAALRMRVGDSRHQRAVEQRDVAHMLAAHHA